MLAAAVVQLEALKRSARAALAAVATEQKEAQAWLRKELPILVVAAAVGRDITVHLQQAAMAAPVS